MGIDLRGADAGVAEHLLDVPDIRTTLAQVGPDGVPQGVDRSCVGYPGPPRIGSV